MKTLTHPLVAGPLGGSLMVLLAYCDAKFRVVDREKSTYWKLFIVSSLVFSTMVYFIAEEYNKIDEFLNQAYDTSLPSLLPSKESLKKAQASMKRPPKLLDVIG
jgi:hypothetical protein